MSKADVDAGRCSVDRPVRPVWFHTVGVGQYFGTVKWHRFEDCGHLRKKRPHWSGPVKRWATTEKYTRVDDRDESEVPESRRCKICERRYRPNDEMRDRHLKQTPPEKGNAQ